MNHIGNGFSNPFSGPSSMKIYSLILMILATMPNVKIILPILLYWFERNEVEEPFRGSKIGHFLQNLLNLLEILKLFCCSLVSSENDNDLKQKYGLCDGGS